MPEMDARNLANDSSCNLVRTLLSRGALMIWPSLPPLSYIWQRRVHRQNTYRTEELRADGAMIRGMRRTA